MPKPSCQVCCDSFTKQVRKRVECSFCHYEACAQCQKKYLLSSSIDARCMNCSRHWNYGFLQSIFPKAWLQSEYAEHRARVLFERERQVLPDAQHQVINYHKAAEIREGIPDKVAEIESLRRQIMALQDAVEEDRLMVRQLAANHYVGDRSIARQKRKRNEYIFPCTTEGCRGFLTSQEEHPSTLMCGVCQTVACSQCGDPVSTSETVAHTCNEDVKLTFAELKKHSKPCPSCAAPTSKIDGCHQMWCTQCHTAWDWPSGQLLRGTVHNPHYFEFLRQSTDGDIPRQPGDTPCGMLTGLQIYRALRAYQHAHPEIDHQSMERCFTYLYRITNHTLHMDNVMIPRARHQIQEHEDRAGLRLSFLLNNLTEENYKRELQWRERRIEKLTALIDLMQTVVGVVSDAIGTFANGSRSLVETVHTLVRFQVYHEEQCLRCERLFNLSFYDARLLIHDPCI